MIRLRLFFLASVLILGFGGVLFRAFQLQILPTDKVAHLARRQLSKRIEIVGRRGVIYDRNGRELAVSTNTLSIFANPKLVTNPAALARMLSPILNVPERALRERLSEAAKKKFIWLARQLSARQLEQLARVDLKNFPGVGTLPEFRREYPQGSLAASILGFSSIDGDGVEGIEHRFDDYLRGDRNSVELKRDALGRPIFTQSEQIRMELDHGSDVELTIDSNLQYATERALREGVTEHGALAGVAIVMDPRNGEVLALANYPTFDPNTPSSFTPDQRRNRAITDPIEPGSVMKPFVVARALEDRVVGPNTLISGGGGTIRIGRKTIHEAEASHRFKTISVTDLIRVSSNVATVNLQQKMGWPRIDDTYRKLGFGKTLGIELAGESRGIFNSPKPSQILEQATMAFGQGISTTPLQIASAYCVIANGGVRVRPKIVKRSPESEAPAAEKAGARVFSEQTCARMRSILEKVVEGEGTGALARVESFKVAGKTGTAKKVDYKNGGYESGAYWSSFAGMIPAQNPRFVIYVMLDRPTTKGVFGAAAAAPLFAKIARAALQLVPSGLELPKKTAIAPVVPVIGQNAREAPRPLRVAGRIPDVTGLPLAQALKALQSSGLEMEILGEGDHVYEQLPIAGAKVEEAKKVYLKLR